MRFEEELKSATAEHGSLVAMSRATGIPPRSLRKYCEGVEPPFSRVVLIADYLGVSLDYLAGKTDNPRPRKLEDSLEAVIDECCGKIAEQTRRAIVETVRSFPESKR